MRLKRKPRQPIDDVFEAKQVLKAGAGEQMTGTESEKRARVATEVIVCRHSPLFTAFKTIGWNRPRSGVTTTQLRVCHPTSQGGCLPAIYQG